MTILVGTASWADKSLVDSGKFYPPDITSPEARLRYYASQFPMGEVDSSYYATPLPVTTQQWAERTPADFVFNVKAFRLFTGHQPSLGSFPRTSRKRSGCLSARTSTTATFRKSFRKSCGVGSSRRWSRCTRLASWAPCIFSSRPGSRRAASLVGSSSIAPGSWGTR